jgi:hypothetical protein
VSPFQAALKATLNLCHPDVCAALSLSNAPDCFRDKSVARAVAHFIRHTTSTQAIFVPSMALLDNLEPWGLVLFLEHLPAVPPLFCRRSGMMGPFKYPDDLCNFSHLEEKAA